MSAWGKANGVTGDDIVCDPSPLHSTSTNPPTNHGLNLLTVFFFFLALPFRPRGQVLQEHRLG